MKQKNNCIKYKYVSTLDILERKIESTLTFLAGCFADISKEARDLLEQADVILSKGQGNFESLQYCGLNIYYLFLCKCDLFTKRFHTHLYNGILTNDRYV